MLTEEVGSALRKRLRGPRSLAAALVFWAIYFLFLRPPAPASPGPLAAWIPAALLPFLVIGSFAWLSPIPWQWGGGPGRLPAFFPGLGQALLSTQAWCLLLVLLSFVLARWSGEPFEWGPLLLTNQCLTAPLMMVVGGILAGQEHAEGQHRKARLQAQEAQMRLLHSQIHPHVLFNSLNGLVELIEKDPVQATRQAQALARLLRKLLDASEEAMLFLQEERALVEDYLALESMRLGERLSCVWRWDPALDLHPVLPLLLQPLVENAIKHGIAPCVAGGRVEISARAEGPLLILEVLNTGAPYRPRGETGMGLRNLAARLELAYGGHASLTLSSLGAEPGTATLACLRLPN